MEKNKKKPQNNPCILFLQTQLFGELVKIKFKNRF